MTMSDQEGVDAAIDKLNGTEIDGQEVKVEQARAREEGRRGGGGFGRDRGGSRSFGDRGRSGGFGRDRRDDRRDDRRGGGGGGGECFNCHKTGHFARDCTDGDRRGDRRGGGGGFGGGRGGGSRACYNCNNEGHMARECPEGDRRDRGGR